MNRKTRNDVKKSAAPNPLDVPRLYDTDDYDADVGNLYWLLEAAMDALGDLDYGTGSNRNHTMDRAAALVHIAQDTAKHMLTQRGIPPR